MRRPAATFLLATIASSPLVAGTVRIESIELLDPQPHASDAAVIWYDAMDAPSGQYFEQKGDLSAEEALGGRGKSLEVFYPKGEKGGGSANRKLAFGGRRVKVDATSGEFTGPRAGRSCLQPGRMHFCRCRGQGGAWSSWHQAFRTGSLPEPEE